MSKVRLGIIGLGNMGSAHAANVLAGKIPRLELTAVGDTDPGRLARAPQVKKFASADEMIASGLIDALLIATPHFDHTTIGIKALQAGLHVMVEKPISVHKVDAERLIAAHTNQRQVFAAMFNQRTDHYYLKIRELIQSGELGEVRRVNWTITDWFRTEQYYASGGWRATWAGEGGGVLLNQGLHNLDLLQWLFGMPKRVRAHCGFGRYHDIEVEDEVTAYLEFASGATGVLITSTGEAPGTNRLEIAAERGKVVYENDTLVFSRNQTPMSEFSRTATTGFARPETQVVPLAVKDHGGQHVGILQNFTAAILDGAALIAPANEGIHSVELVNAMLLSAWTDETVILPLDGKRFERLLQQKIAGSKVKKSSPVQTKDDDFGKSFGR
ncbi:MAG: Gfo/Idh/MocA family oxidoreductase [Opitutaceae bacterium]|nr:Gfo/Idh/MocA family oxidoreductase [Opitutaceae bacterium]